MAIHHQSQVAIERLSFGTTTEIVVRGELDIASSADLRRDAEAALRDAPERIVVDLREVAFIDSTGINTLLRLRSRAIAQSVDMIVMRPAGTQDRIFQVCGIDGIFPKLDGTARGQGG